MMFQPMPLISRGCPAYASSGTPGLANNGNYADQWSGSIAATLDYDLSGVPSAQRGQCIVAWYNDPATSAYDHTLNASSASAIPKNYTLQGNAAAGGSDPSTGWVTLVTVTGNVYHSRQHLVNLTGYNWLRMSVTAVEDSSSGTSASINLDVHDAHLGVQDDWIFYGDSITAQGLAHDNGNSNGTFAQMVNQLRPGYFPAFEDGGIYGTKSGDGAATIATWLGLFPGKYVGLNYGTNDAINGVSPATFQANYAAMIQAVLAQGCVLVIPTIPWSPQAATNAPALNGVIAGLYNTYPQIVPGPDLWAFFTTHQSLISGDGIHPTAAGYSAYRSLWVGSMVYQLYSPTRAYSAFSYHHS
jgi:lysophospholipase L1-like esterase